jgi:hypothetical protein
MNRIPREKGRSLLKQIIFVLTITSTPMFAAPKEKTFPANCDHVWAAVKRATAPPHYNFAMLDDAQKKGVISTGNNLSGKRNLDLALSGTGETCTISVGGMFSGLIHNDKGDLFKRIEDELKAPQPEPAPFSVGAPPPDQTVASPPVKVALGQTTDQVVAILGQPKNIVDLGAKKIFVYRDLKITFNNGQVVDVE